ncbi:hypothetical protein [Kitasatospora sp. NPDC050543]|uniref:hypothetical protein n=1 Tax=Kitasatospora sp. NPDC050543 TaxID=3364054 RepID=UPI0037A3D470
MSDSTSAPAQLAQPAVADPAPAVAAQAPQVPQAASASELPQLPQPPAVPAPVRRRLLRATAATVAAALVGVGIGVGIIKVEYGDDAPAAVAGAPATASPATTATPGPVFGAKSNGNHFGSLRDLLLPVPYGYALGPDHGLDGNDAELTSDQLAAEIDADLADVPKDKREQFRAYWQGLHVKATGVRSLVSGSYDVVVQLRLSQFNQQEVQRSSDLTALFADVYRLGPEIPGHPEAHCYLPPAPPGEEIDHMECAAAEGDLLALMSVEGLAPLPKDKLVTLFTQQLDRLARPGASV